MLAQSLSNYKSRSNILFHIHVFYMTIFTLAKLIGCLVYCRNHKLCILMPLSILSDNYSHHIDIHHLHGLLHCGFLNFVLMWLHNRTGNRNIFYLHWPLICGTWNRIYLWLFYHTGYTSMERFTVEPKSVLFLKLIIALITLNHFH